MATAASQSVIAFHGIGHPGRELEPGESRYWITRERFLRFLDLVATAPDPGRVHLTFDDCNESDFTIAMPALQARGLAGSFFIITSRLDRPGSLSTPQLQALALAMEVGSHGINHLDWRRLDAQQLDGELVGSKQVLESCIGRTVTAASFPFGRYDPRVLSAVRRAGYVRVYSTDGGRSRPTDNVVHRTNVRAETSLQNFVDLMQGRETWSLCVARKLKAVRRWLR